MKREKMKHKKTLLFFVIAILLTLPRHCFAQHHPPVIEWQKCFGGSWMENGSSIIRTSDGGYLVAGATSSYDGTVEGHHKYDSIAFNLWWGARYDLWILKLDSMGT